MNLEELRRDEASLFVVKGGSDGDSAILVRGWKAVVRQYAEQCIDAMDPDRVLVDAEFQLAEGMNAEEWDFGPNGTARLHQQFEDGWWSVSRVTPPALAA